MVTVGQLLDHNSLMNDYFLPPDSFLARLKGVNHRQMIKDYGEKVTDRERNIAYVVQLIFYSMTVGANIGASLLIASYLGRTYWNIAANAALVGLCVGTILGVENNEKTPLKLLELKADIYASYQSRFKYLQPLHEMAADIVFVASQVMICSYAPKLGVIHAVILPFSLSVGIVHIISLWAIHSSRRAPAVDKALI